MYATIQNSNLHVSSLEKNQFNKHQLNKKIVMTNVQTKNEMLRENCENIANSKHAGWNLFTKIDKQRLSIVAKWLLCHRVLWQDHADGVLISLIDWLVYWIRIGIALPSSPMNNRIRIEFPVTLLKMVELALARLHLTIW